MLDRAGLERAVICGVSFGGLIALRFAATRPDRAAGAGPRLDAGAGLEANARVSCVTCGGRAFSSLVRGDVAVAASAARYSQRFPNLREAADFSVRHTGRIVAAPLAPQRMAERVRMLMAVDSRADCARVEAPTLVITGESTLDRVVPATARASTWHDPRRAIRHARADGPHRSDDAAGGVRGRSLRDFAHACASRLTGPAGPLEALLDEPAVAPRAAAVFAHPLPTHGGTMHTKAVYQAAKALARIGCAVLRFNFRGVGRSAGRSTKGAASRRTFAAALDFMARALSGIPLWAAGFSFGSWVALSVGAADPRVATAASALRRHSKDAATTSRVSRRAPSRSSSFMASADESARLKRCTRFYAQLQEPKELVVIDGADHLFDGKISEVGDAVEDLLGDYHDRRSHRLRVRTPVGKAPKGTLRATRPDELAAAVIAEALERAPGLEPAEIDDVILGCAMPEAEQG